MRGEILEDDVPGQGTRATLEKKPSKFLLDKHGFDKHRDI